ncbi:MAG: hypothetical protein AAFP85_17365 [Pseudomonadota bacterium]
MLGLAERHGLSGLLSDALLLPAVLLGVLAFLVPRGLAKVLPEGVKPLLLNAFLSTLILFLLSAGLFFALYIGQGVAVADLMVGGVAANILFFGKLGLAAAIIWGPIMILSLAGLPRKWVKETW